MNRKGNDLCHLGVGLYVYMINSGSHSIELLDLINKGITTQDNFVIFLVFACFPQVTLKCEKDSFSQKGPSFHEKDPRYRY